MAIEGKNLGISGKSLGIFGEMGKSSMAFVWCETSHFCEKLEKHVMQKVPKKKTGLGPRTSLYLLKWEEKEIGGIILVEGQPHVKLNIPYMIP